MHVGGYQQFMAPSSGEYPLKPFLDFLHVAILGFGFLVSV
jgi:hypothetical protein